MGRKETIVNPTEQYSSCPLPSPKPELTDSEGQMEVEKLKAQCQKAAGGNTHDIQHSGGEEQHLAICHYRLTTTPYHNNRTNSTVSQHLYSPDHHSKQNDLPSC